MIRFCQKYLKSKVMDKVWLKLDREGQGFITVDKFPDLVAFIAILHRVKEHQKRTKSKSVPRMNNKEIRAHIEHVSFWIAERFIYDKESNSFQVRQDAIRDEFSTWCQPYVEAEGSTAARH